MMLSYGGKGAGMLKKSAYAAQKTKFVSINSPAPPQLTPFSKDTSSSLATLSTPQVFVWAFLIPGTTSLSSHFTTTPGHPTMPQKSQFQPHLFWTVPQSWPSSPPGHSFLNAGCKSICLSPENAHVMLALKAFLPNWTPPCGPFYVKNTDWN